MFNASAIIASSYLPWEENRKKKKVLKAALQLANVDFDKAGSGRS